MAYTKPSGYTNGLLHDNYEFSETARIATMRKGVTLMVDTGGIANKLRILPGKTLLVLNAPDQALALLQPLPSGVELTTTLAGASDVTLLFARDSAQLGARLADALAATVAGGAFWVCYPKKSAKLGDLSREAAWELVRPTGWGPVAQIALDETWSALRFRPEAEIARQSARA